MTQESEANVAEDRPLLLLVSDDPAQCRLIKALAGREGWHTVIARDRAAAIAEVDRQRTTAALAIVLDQCGDADDAFDLAAELRSRSAGLPIVALIDHGSAAVAARALRAGASDFVFKPLASDRMIAALRAAMPSNRSGDELAVLSEKLPLPPGFDAMVGSAPEFLSALATAAKAARGSDAMLIEGEPGTGRETLVRAIHAASRRGAHKLQVLRLGDTPPGSLESALFGHEKNAFLGAFDRHVGALEGCNGATLVLDGIERLPGPLQHRLLDTIRSGAVQPIGAKYSVPVDVRLIALSTSAKGELLGGGQMLAELVEALSAVTVRLPPLRERKGDIAPLAGQFLARIGKELGLPELSLSDRASALLSAYDWPGNVRQLSAVLFRAAVTCSGTELTPEDFPQLAAMPGSADVATPARRAPGSAELELYTAGGHLRPLEEIEDDVIRLAIGHYHGRMTRVARQLRIGRSTLYRKLGKLGLEGAGSSH